MSPHSLSRRVRDLLTGDHAAHPDLPVAPDPEPELPAPETPPVIESTTGGCRPADAAAAWDGRHELEDLAGIVDVLIDVERRAAELNRRAAELVKGRLYPVAAGCGAAAVERGSVDGVADHPSAGRPLAAD